MASRRKEVQKLLSEAEKLVQQATKICIEDELDGVSFMDQTFHIFKNHYRRGQGRLAVPNWFTDEYWQSSSAECEVHVIYEEESDE